MQLRRNLSIAVPLPVKKFQAASGVRRQLGQQQLRQRLRGNDLVLQRIERHFAMCRIAPELATHIDRNHAQPMAEVRRLAQLRELAVRQHEGVLRQVFRMLPIADATKTQAQDILAIAFHQRSEGIQFLTGAPH